MNLSVIAGALGIMFIGLKLLHVIAWSWLWVLAPFWGPLVVLAAIFLCVFVGALVVGSGPKMRR